MKHLLLLSILLSASSAFALTLTGKVLSIHDGDTITILPENGAKKSKVRLLGVDTPEIDFNGSSQGEVAELARDYLKSLLPLNAIVKIELDDKNVDVNGRYLGVIFYQGMELNLEMLKSGWGATYFIYPFNKKLLVNYQAVSKIASDNHLGIFSDKFKSQPLGYMFRQMTKGVPGTNLVADYETKKLYSGEDTELVPHYHRVFFSSEETALGHGFSW